MGGDEVKRPMASSQRTLPCRWIRTAVVFGVPPPVPASSRAASRGLGAGKSMSGLFCLPACLALRSHSRLDLTAQVGKNIIIKVHSVSTRCLHWGRQRFRLQTLILIFGLRTDQYPHHHWWYRCSNWHLPGTYSDLASITYRLPGCSNAQGLSDAISLVSSPFARRVSDSSCRWCRNSAFHIETASARGREGRQSHQWHTTRYMVLVRRRTNRFHSYRSCPFRRRLHLQFDGMNSIDNTHVIADAVTILSSVTWYSTSPRGA